MYKTNLLNTYLDKMMILERWKNLSSSLKDNYIITPFLNCFGQHGI